jgi:hypothetical protein
LILSPKVGVLMNVFAYVTSAVLLFSSIMCPLSKPKPELKWDKMGEVGGVVLYINVYKKGDYNHVLWKVVNQNDCKITFCPWSKTFHFGDKTEEHTEEYISIEAKATVVGKEAVDDELSESFYKKEVMAVEINIAIDVIDDEDVEEDGPDVSIALGAV